MNNTELLIKPGFYRHYKGKLYHVLGVAQHSETQELYVVYTPLYEHSGVGLSIRPLEMFKEIVKVPKFSPLGNFTTHGEKATFSGKPITFGDYVEVPRFEFIGDKL